MTGFLALEDGTVFRGQSVGAEGVAFGEAVFTTAMTGYQEVVTDPSYAEQVVCFTAPMIGNYGVARWRSESIRTHARAVVMREARGPDWTDWLTDHEVVALSGIDTRSLVLHLRQAGAMRAAAVSGEAALDEVLEQVRAQPPMAGRSLAAEVSAPEPYVFSDTGAAHIAVVDYGCKLSILNRLAWKGAAVTVYPHDADADELARYDGVLLSNGPGDPEPLRGSGQDDRGAARANGGARHLPRAPAARPRDRAQDVQAARSGTAARTTRSSSARSGRVLVTSQNHGFAVAPSEEREATYVSLYDGTVEGLDYPSLGARSVQFHPEAGPGPHDAWRILDDFVQEVGLAKAA